MIRRILVSSIAVVASTSLVAFAAPKEDLTAAAKKLSDAKNYSWKQTTEMGGDARSCGGRRTAGGGGGGGGGGNFRPGPVEGKAEKDGPTVLLMSFGDNTIEIVRQGEKGAVKLQDGWQSFEELRQAGQGGGG